MNRNSKYAVALLLFCLLFSCQKELRFVSALQPSVSNNQWQFDESTLHFEGKTDSAILTISPGFESISLHGSSSVNNETLFIRITTSGKLKPGVYKNTDLYFLYARSGVMLYRNGPPSADDFILTITSVDSVSVSGTFSGITKDGAGTVKNITHGKFSATFTRKSVITADTSSGQVVFWAREGCGANASSPVKIIIGNKEGQVTTFYHSEPACDAEGTARFILPEGHYTCLAICGTDSATIGVSVIKGTCTKAEAGFCNSSISDGCQIAVDTLFFPPAQELSAKIFTFNTLKQVEKIQKVNLLNSEVQKEIRLSYSVTQIKINADDYFNLDGCGRIREYRGTDVPGTTQAQKLFIRYYYNTQGYMEKVTYADANNSGVIKQEITLTWNAGNLTKAIWKDLTSVANTEYNYEYGLNLQAKNFACFIPNNPITYLQSALNFGKNSANLVSKITVKRNTAQGQQFTDEVYYTGYNFNADNYVTYFVVSGNSNYFFNAGSHFLGHKCF
ncbi:MAG: hypothetical protein SFU87_20455 [Chitinophagaceae bacterium]|nr:hypothetical protein [Chitinophagaceae bacterium]